jgi:hypothetical protein
MMRASHLTRRWPVSVISHEDCHFLSDFSVLLHPNRLNTAMFVQPPTETRADQKSPIRAL